MKIKYKFIIGLSLILLSSGILLNIIINQVLIKNLENNVNDSLSKIMSSTKEYMKYKLLINAPEFNEEGLKQESSNIAKYISLNYQCDTQINNMHGDIIKKSGESRFEDTISRATSEAIKGNTVAILKYSNDSVVGILSYPLYIDNNYLGVINITKNYDDIYGMYKNTTRIITSTLICIFILIFILAYVVASKITTPITSLTKVVKQVAQGEFKISINIKSNDEVGILSREFINMKDKINEQMLTISQEKRKVENLEKSRNEFFNRVTHELKTPLTTITGYSEMLLDEMVADEEFKKIALKSIHSESNRLNKLVLDLIEVSKGLSFIEEEKKSINMAILLEQICNDMSIKARKYSLQINRDICEGEILGQNNKIKQLIINIIDNSIKYSINGEKIIVRSKLEDTYYILEVENRGEAIPEEIFNHIFDPFVKSEKTLDNQSRGLGLYICKEIVKDHNGELTIENGETIITKIKIPAFVANLVTS
ncbi:HAMP domain-containing histidine kinase [Clostridium sp. SHJSY1]|uniref:HAMP domain-containing sensor histidine kinase n=1 Tax=Clostridium sp. SHJSY1 TaxID=2942483 RepID=UPI002875C2AA|nr:HAMP domain-containing sensor histidine kinase [Clostridium sp. SHJSY1]MDS0527406.1 HAMP domain-containing histidine kinase [Clostridium sp. SHJSY1]